MDETLLYLYEPESKQQYMVWKHADSPSPKKARTSKSAGKYMFMVFMDAHGLILHHTIPAGTTVNAAYILSILYTLIIHKILIKNVIFPIKI